MTKSGLRGSSAAHTPVGRDYSERDFPYHEFRWRPDYPGDRVASGGQVRVELSERPSPHENLVRMTSKASSLRGFRPCGFLSTALMNQIDTAPGSCINFFVAVSRRLTT